MLRITPYHAKYFAHFLTRQLPANDLGKLTTSLHDAQDEVDERKEQLLTEIEKMLAQQLHQEELFTIKWRLI